MSDLFTRIGMETDLTEWTGTTVGSPNTLARDATGGLNGTTAGGKIVINSSANATFFTRTFTAISSSDFVFEFYINDLTLLTIPTGHNIDLWRPYSNSDTVQRGYGRIHNNAGTFQLIHSIRNDGGSFPSETVTWGTNPSKITVHMHKGSGTAFQKVYFDGVLMGSGITGETVSTTFIYDAIRIGATQISSASTTGTIRIDEVIANNDGNLYAAADPTVTDISNQTGTFGTQKTVACTIADADGDLARCDVSTGGTALITLTAATGGTVFNNGTTAAYVTGTHAGVVNTLGNGIKLDGVRNGTELSHVETITVLVTDALSATGGDTFTMTWSVPTGVGTQTLHLTGTHAQLNAALVTVEVTGTVLETIQCLMYSVTSTPLTDTDIFTITVQNEAVSIAVVVSPLSVKGSGSFSKVFIITFPLEFVALTEVSDATSIGAAITLGGLFAGLSHDQIVKINNRKFSIRVFGDLATTSGVGTITLNESELI